MQVGFQLHQFDPRGLAVSTSDTSRLSQPGNPGRLSGLNSQQMTRVQRVLHLVSGFKGRKVDKKANLHENLSIQTLF